MDFCHSARTREAGLAPSSPVILASSFYVPTVGEPRLATSPKTGKGANRRPGGMRPSGRLFAGAALRAPALSVGELGVDKLAVETGDIA